MAEETPPEPRVTWKEARNVECDDLRRAGRRVEKKQVPIVLRLMNYRIEGVMHVAHKHRILDILNNPEPFLPITQARVYNGATGALMAETDFLAINKDQIVLLREDHAPSHKDEAAEILREPLPRPLEEPEDEELGSVSVSEEPADG